MEVHGLRHICQRPAHKPAWNSKPSGLRLQGPRPRPARLPRPGKALGARLSRQAGAALEPKQEMLLGVEAGALGPLQLNSSVPSPCLVKPIPKGLTLLSSNPHTGVGEGRGKPGFKAALVSG